MFNETEITMLTDALNMAIASNKRMQVAKPRFNDMFATIIRELEQLKHKVATAPTKNK